MKNPIKGASNRCCLCLDIHCGVKALGWLQIFMAGVSLWTMLSILIMMTLTPINAIIWFIIYIVAIGPIMLGGWYYLKFLR